MLNGTEASSLKVTTFSMTISPSRRKIGATRPTKTEAFTLRFSRVFVQTEKLSSLTNTTLRNLGEFQRELMTWAMATMTLSNA